MVKMGCRKDTTVSLRHNRQAVYLPGEARHENNLRFMIYGSICDKWSGDAGSVKTCFNCQTPIEYCNGGEKCLIKK